MAAREFPAARACLRAGWLLVLTAALAAGAPARAAGLADGLRRQAPEVMTYLQKQGYHNVGILPFRLKEGDKVGFALGTLNRTAASRLQTALLLAEDLDHPVGIIQDAGTVAAGIRGADHTTPAGRQKLFAFKDWPLLWGDERVAADAFVTGLVRVRDDRQTLGVALCVFDRDGKFKLFDQFNADMDPNLLVETGSSFRLRGFGDNGEVKTTRTSAKPTTQEKVAVAVKTAAAVAKDPEKNPLLDKDSPIGLKVFYDGQPVELTPQDGQLQVPEPQPGQQVKLLIRKRDTANVRYGVVVKVNGLNTLFKETKQALDCTKWILSNDFPQAEIVGFEMPQGVVETFDIKSAEESKALESKYGQNVGQINVVVFREESKGTPSDLPTDVPGGAAPPGADSPVVNKAPDPKRKEKKEQDALDALAVDLGLAGGGDKGQAAPKPKTPEEAQQDLRSAADNVKQARRGLRGLIGEGGGLQPGGVQRVKFVPDPVPVMAATVTYYHPAGR